MVISKIWAPVLYREQAGGVALCLSSLLPSPVIGGAAALPTDQECTCKALSFRLLTRGVLSMHHILDSDFGQLRTTV